MDAERRAGQHSADEDLVYSPVARLFHWLTVIFVAIMIPVGLYMVYRGKATNFDALTNTLYSGHKLAGFALLWIVVLRLAYRFSNGAPPDEPTLEWWQKIASHLNHWGLYALLLAMPILGWLGVTLYPALGVFGVFSLPAIPGVETLYGIVSQVGGWVGFAVPPSSAAGGAKAELVFKLHFWGAMALLAVAGVHVAAAIYHHFIRGDGVLRRMLPGLTARGR